MLQPKRVKYRKAHSIRPKGTAHAGYSIVFGDFGLKAQEPTWLTARQIEAARRAITHYVKRGGMLWIRAFPDRPITKKPAETRMGGGKGIADHWAAVVKRGAIVFELGGVSEPVAREALRLAAHKLPMATTFVVKETLTSQAGGKA